jgi:hypothetical protein
VPISGIFHTIFLASADKGPIIFVELLIKGKFLGAEKNGGRFLKGQSHEKVGKMSVWGVCLGPN